MFIFSHLHGSILHQINQSCPWYNSPISIDIFYWIQNSTTTFHMLGTQLPCNLIWLLDASTHLCIRVCLVRRLARCNCNQTSLKVIIYQWHVPELSCQEVASPQTPHTTRFMLPASLFNNPFFHHFFRRNVVPTAICLSQLCFLISTSPLITTLIDY